MGEFSVSHLLIVAIVLLVFFGPSRLPGLGQSLGKAIRGFKEGLDGEPKDSGALNGDPSSSAQPISAQPNSVQTSQAGPGQADRRQTSLSHSAPSAAAEPVRPQDAESVSERVSAGPSEPGSRRDGKPS